ncbi:MAG: hypothetical protein AB7D51_12115 [Desulfovibrionaceae bacterium]
MRASDILYDAQDEKLLDILQAIQDRGAEHADFKTLLTPYLRPHGIKELAASWRLRTAYAVIHLLGSLESAQASERLLALAALRDEVLTASSGPMRNNRARVLIQIAKELIRARGDRQRQLRLAHDFRAAALGKKRFLRKQLRKYHLLEMPEAWNQVSFDDRVHDANSKGRKSATHLMMDAWIKGIRNLRIIYYDAVERAVVHELFASARLLGVNVRVGIEYKSRFRGRFVRIILDPGLMQDDSDVEGFFEREAVQRLLALGREVQALRTEHVRAMLRAFNERHRLSIRQELGVLLPEVRFEDVLRTVGTGQPSLWHLGKHLHEVALPHFRKRVDELAQEYRKADYDGMAAIAMQVESLNAFDADTIVARYLAPSVNPDIPNPDQPLPEVESPELLRLSPAELTARLREACPAGRLTLCLADVRLEDALEILYDCRGRITRLEMFNLRTITFDQVRRRQPISELQQALNNQNAVALKRMIRACLDARLAEPQQPGNDERVQKLRQILNDFEQLREFYKHTRLKTKVGSGSTGGSSRTPGMGLAVLETLPPNARHELQRRRRACLPLDASLVRSVEFTPPETPPTRLGALVDRLAMLPGLRSLLCRTRTIWRMTALRVREGRCGNVVPLGGAVREADNALTLHPETGGRQRRFAPEYLNSTLKNALKVLIGFIPAFLTFYLTKDWWVLAWLGAPLWFSITGIRNVIQAVLGGGGLGRSTLLRWNDYVYWDRIADSLLYTGFSVPLLDWLCKSLLLDQGFGINTATNPTLLYAVMALFNGTYISTHNIFRGLPREAAFANFFRSILSIPLAVAFNAAAGGLMEAAGAQGVDQQLQLWAAVISKLASDCVAGIIEGIADRNANLAMRRWDYAEKLKQVFEVFSTLEILHPEQDMCGELEAPERFLEHPSPERARMVPILMVNALDLLYLRLYQPRGKDALRRAMLEMNREERRIFLASQRILEAERDISRLFVDGLVGRDFSRALSFYLLRHDAYMTELAALAASLPEKGANTDGLLRCL